MNQRHIYFDHNASTPLCAAAQSAIQHAMVLGVGNPSATHWSGTASKTIIESARQQCAEAFAAHKQQVIFNSGGTESDNHALHAAVFLQQDRSTILHSAIEHPAVQECAAAMQAQGKAKAIKIPVNQDGRCDLDALRLLLHEHHHDVAVISVMHANNECGSIQAIKEIAALAHEHGAFMHCDAAQSVGKIPVSMKELDCDLLSIAGHKFGAPKGIGALLVSEDIADRIPPLLFGGGHEQGRRPGTESTLLIAALGAACQDIQQRLQHMHEVELLRDYFESALHNLACDITIYSKKTARLPNTSYVSFNNHIGSDILARIPHVAASTGSACNADRIELSPVLKAMQVSEDLGKGSIRFSFGPENTRDEVDMLIAALADILAKQN